jgi:hypothetical protein
VNAKLVEDIANAVLYEGYMLYPYRPSSVKNRQRWNFGVIYPKAYSDTQNGTDDCFMQTECIATGTSYAKVGIKVRFLQAVARTVGKLIAPLDELPAGVANGLAPGFRFAESIEVDGQLFQAWQEAVECEMLLPAFSVGADKSARQSSAHFFPGGREPEPVRDADGKVAGIIVRTKEPVFAGIDVNVTTLRPDLYKITVRISNTTEKKSPDLDYEHSADRDAALMQSLLSAHTILTIDGGEFVSMIDPPASLKELVAGCKNAGTWPVLAGEENRRHMMLSSPIILYDYPQIAPESPGDLFDGTEIDEILALRILTLTEDEKKEMRHADVRSRQILERTESMPMEHFLKLHGVLRGLRSADEDKQ